MEMPTECGPRGTFTHTFATNAMFFIDFLFGNFNLGKLKFEKSKIQLHIKKITVETFVEKVFSSLLPFPPDRFVPNR